VGIPASEEFPVAEPEVTNPWASGDAVRDAMRAWRADHPHATWVEIERALDERVGRWRAQVLAETVASSPLRDFRGAAARPPCPVCDVPLRAMGQHERTVITNEDAAVTVERTYGECPRCGAGFFPPG